VFGTYWCYARYRLLGQQETGFMPKTSKQIAIVGGGPTAVYTVKHLLKTAGRFQITIFEAGTVAGSGIPYSEDQNGPQMMANITSLEIPPVLISLADWLRSADDKVLGRFGLDRHSIGERDFYPRIVIGSYYADQLLSLKKAGEMAGHSLVLETETLVRDIEPKANGFVLTLEQHGKDIRKRFDMVFMATGHLTDLKKTNGSGRLFRSPYPTQELALGPDRAALVLGTSLSAIDAVIALATRYGTFSGIGVDLRYSLRGDKPMRLVMASRKGILPEADFYYPIPEEPLFIFSPARLEALEKTGKTGFLSRAMALFRQQLAADDPEFYEALNLARFTPESFGKAYFALRKARYGFEPVADNLAEARTNHERKHIVMWRYTLMRAHEVFSKIVPFLDRKDLARFRKHLAPVFSDAYGCVPHVSIERLLALHQAGYLDIAALGEDGAIRYGGGTFSLSGCGKDQSFGVLIDARGQSPETIASLGFAKLDAALQTTDFFRRSEAQSEDDQFRLPLEAPLSADIFCLSIPVMMHRYPFAQGLVACADAAEIAVGAL
jgi:uncharacterized NAD(P)/FAD-binding protein YdhS